MTRSGTEEYHIDIRQTGDELVVVADMQGVSKDDLVVKFDPTLTGLVIGKKGAKWKRIPLRCDSVQDIEASFKNGVLEVRVRSNCSGGTR